MAWRELKTNLLILLPNFQERDIHVSTVAVDCGRMLRVLVQKQGHLNATIQTVLGSNDSLFRTQVECVFPSRDLQEVTTATVSWMRVAAGEDFC